MRNESQICLLIHRVEQDEDFDVAVLGTLEVDAAGVASAEDPESN